MFSVRNGPQRESSGATASLLVQVSDRKCSLTCRKATTRFLAILGSREFGDCTTVLVDTNCADLALGIAVDQDGDLLDILVQSRKDKRAAKRFFRKLLKGQERILIEMTTDKLRNYAAAKREMMPSVVHCQDKYANNRSEVSHEHTRGQERQMRRLHHRVRHNGFSAFMGRYTICFGSGVIFCGQQTIEPCVAARS